MSFVLPEDLLRKCEVSYPLFKKLFRFLMGFSGSSLAQGEGLYEEHCECASEILGGRGHCLCLPPPHGWMMGRVVSDRYWIILLKTDSPRNKWLKNRHLRVQRNFPPLGL